MNQKGRPKIAFFLPSLEGGGAERNLINILPEINTEKYHLTLIAAKRKGVFLSQVPFYISIVDFKGEFLLNVFLKLIYYFGKEKPDIFVSTFERFNFVGLLAKFFALSKVKFVVIEQTTPSKLYLTASNVFHKIIAYLFLPFLLKFFYSKADCIICVSEGIKNDISRFINSENKLKVIYNPVVKEKIYQLASEKVSHPWFENKTIPIIVAGGRLVKAKDYPTLFKALAVILKNRPVRLVVLGDGLLKKELEKLSQKMGIKEAVDFLGFQENPYKYFSRSSVFVNSSIREGFSNVIVEAMACGLPVVSTDCSGPKEIIKDGQNGFLVPVGNYQKLSEKIIAVLTDKSLAQRLSNYGKKRAQDFTVEKSVKNYQQVFNQLLYE